MAHMVQMNTRIDAEDKRRGDAVFARAGLTPSDVVRAVWRSAAQTQQVPECVRSDTPADPELERRLEAIRRGAGLANRMAGEMLGCEIGPCYEPLDYKALRDQMYDELLEEMEARHA